MIPGFSVTIKRNGVPREKTQTANSPAGELTVLFRSVPFSKSRRRTQNRQP